VYGERVEGIPAAALSGKVSSYYGFRESTPAPLRRREGPGRDVVLILSFDEEWRIDGERLVSFAAGLYQRQVTTEHAGRSFGMHVNLTPPAAYTLFGGLPLHTLAERAVPLDDVLGDASLVERLYDAGDWAARFRLLDDWLLRRLVDAPPPSPGVVFAWRRLLETSGRVPVGDLAAELGWSRKRIVARFREEVGLAPKAAARLLRFERARELASRADRPDWLRLALECGYYDQSHLINDFRAFTGGTPETFLQDTTISAA
jgi:AraC-like DNA-binding protein